MSDVRLPIVALDGPAGSGKSTVARLVARQAGLQFISSGAMYRAVALLAQRAGVPATDRDALIALAEQLELHFTTDPDSAVRAWMDGVEVTDALRQPGVEQIASIIATIPELRARLVRKQQEYGRRGGIIMEGRDIQTVVFPDAEFKIFLTASAEERARRRWKELHARDERLTYAEVLAEVEARDRRDEERAASPLRAAPDAIIVNTDGLTIAQVVERVLCIITQKHT